MQINELVTFAADVGRGLLESGAETSRVEDTVERIIRHFYDGKSEVLVVMTGLFVTVGDVTKTVRVRRRTINPIFCSYFNNLPSASLTRAGLALPFILRMTCPTKKLMSLVLPPL